MDIVQFYTIGFFLGLFVYHFLLITAYQKEEKEAETKELAEAFLQKQKRCVFTVAVNLIVFLPLIGRIFNAW